MTARGLLITGFSVFALSNASVAQNNSDVVQQGGRENTAKVYQEGNRGNRAETVQSGNDNYARHTQRGVKNKSGIGQDGNYNEAEVDQQNSRRRR